jgi:hypothetical protein
VLTIAVSPQDPATAAGAVPSTRPALRRHAQDDPDRREIESFIEAIYQRRYAAQVRRFAPELVSLRDERGAIVAAAGYRAAASGPLYLERYLDSPVEHLLGGVAHAQASRERIVEVGHLAAAKAGEGRRLALLLAPHLTSLGFQWVVSTLTEELRQLFRRLGIVPLALGAADPLALGDEARGWGSYYEHRPVVLAGQLGLAMETLARRESAS